MDELAVELLKAWVDIQDISDPVGRVVALSEWQDRVYYWAECLETGHSEGCFDSGG